jgi:hypothetical protein
MSYQIVEVFDTFKYRVVSEGYCVAQFKRRQDAEVFVRAADNEKALADVELRAQW